MSELHACTRLDLTWIIGLRAKAERWLAMRGDSQFQDPAAQQRARNHITALVEQNRFVRFADKAVAALVPPDRDFWQDSDNLSSAWYVGRLMVAEHGEGWGEKLIALLATAAAGDGRAYLRLDCWRSNTRLHDYYRRVGFDWLRTMPVPGRNSGALFEMPLAPLPTPWDAS